MITCLHPIVRHASLNSMAGVLSHARGHVTDSCPGSVCLWAGWLTHLLFLDFFLQHEETSDLSIRQRRMCQIRSDQIRSKRSRYSSFPLSLPFPYSLGSAEHWHCSVCKHSYSVQCVTLLCV